MDKNITKFNISRKQKRVFRGETLPGMAKRVTVGAGGIEIMRRKQSIASLCPLNRFGYFFDKKYQTNPEFGKGKGDNSSRERGSALLVTIMITSVVLLFAMILLERIIPYSRQIRGLQDSVQSYYSAKSQIELAKKDFPIERTNVGGVERVESGADGSLSIGAPQLTSENPGTYVIISEGTHLPLKIKLFENDKEPRRFGLSQKNPDFHLLTSFGGFLFDLTKRDTATTPFSMEITTDAEDETVTKNLGIEFVRDDGGTVTPFFGNRKSINTLNEVNMADIVNNNRETLGSILSTSNCLSATCSLKVSLTETAPIIIPVSFTVSTAIPDLNAVIIADGISPNTAYHSRIIELIPLIQGI